MSKSSPGTPPTPLHSVSVAGVVVREDGCVLAIQRADNGSWEPPGGVLELAEGVEDGVRREVFEETGVKVEVERLTGVYKNLAHGIVALVFRCRPEDGQHPRTTDEATAAAWLTAEEVSVRMAEVYAVRVLDALAEQGPRVRAHDGRRLVEG